MASPELAAAIASLLNDDQERILSLASSLRAPNRTIESTVKGTSMGSGLPPDSRIRIDMSPAADLRLGQVIAFVGGNQLIVHRLVHLGRDFVLTRGDARLAPDSPVRRDQILGPVISVARDDRWESLAAPASRGALGRACAPLVLLAARALLHLGPGFTGAVMHLLHVVEGRAHLTLARLLSSPR
jgi:hypothetical protein